MSIGWAHLRVRLGGMGWVGLGRVLSLFSGLGWADSWRAGWLGWRKRTHAWTSLSVTCLCIYSSVEQGEWMSSLTFHSTHNIVRLKIWMCTIAMHSTAQNSSFCLILQKIITAKMFTGGENSSLEYVGNCFLVKTCRTYSEQFKFSRVTFASKLLRFCGPQILVEL